ncbi:DUF4234 domain-containing protein [Vulgatibacter incomptus]|uniref:Uncharacterized protein n=1 Tax=Vulgatibacter incomptus TaxID=1391653 RepID=A0A0K1PA02_9BACT|nr:DUF4234 domain-containing protein [Vulgatibacter incomptus]AKU90241.1 hypothetical protein AKJ08_0628 [Vulgatibacter incomptus]
MSETEPPMEPPEPARAPPGMGPPPPGEPKEEKEAKAEEPTPRPKKPSGQPPQPPPREQGGPLLEPVSTWSFVLLSIVTLGIYAIYRFYKATKAYEWLAGRTSSFSGFFWAYVVSSFLFFPAALVFGALALNEAIDLRDEAAERYEVPTRRFHSKGTHVVLWVVGTLTVWVLLGIVALVFQAIYFFGEYNRIARGMEEEGAGEKPLLPSPHEGEGGAKEHSRSAATAEQTCSSCGEPLPTDARFCRSCGKPVEPSDAH